MKQLLVAVCLLIVTTITNAQQKRDTVHAASSHQKTKIKDELKLDKKQTETLKASQQDYKDKASKVKADSSMSKKDRKKELKKLKKEKQDKLDAVLTPEQKEKEKQLRKEKKDRKAKG